VYINPLGFAFEGFDGMGRARELDNQVPVDTSGRFPFADGTRAFTDAVELMQLIAQSPEAHTCYSAMLTEYALGRDVADNDEPLLEELAEVSREGSLKRLALALILEPAFRVRQQGPQ
jgi:hypothetical protein